MTRLDAFRQRLARAGLMCEVWSPGDGRTRYEFYYARPDGRNSGYQPFSRIALGISEAELALTAYEAGRQSARAEGMPHLA